MDLDTNNAANEVTPEYFNKPGTSTSAEPSKASAEPSRDLDFSKRTGKSKFFVERDGKTKWAKECPKKFVRTRQENLITLLPGVRNNSKYCKLPVDCWKLFIDNLMVADIVKYTNIKLNVVDEKYNNQHKYIVKPTDVDEMKAVFGLL